MAAKLGLPRPTSVSVAAVGCRRSARTPPATASRPTASPTRSGRRAAAPMTARSRPDSLISTGRVPAAGGGKCWLRAGGPRSHLPPAIRHCYDGPRREDLTVDADERQAERFEEHRPHLRKVAYRMLGSLSEADDAVQEAWLRLSRSDADAVANLGGWLTTVVAPRVPGHAARPPPRREELAGHVDCPSRSLSAGERRRPRAAGRAGRLGRARPARRARHAVPRRAPGLRPARHVRRALRGGRPDRRPLARRRAPARQPRAAPGRGAAPCPIPTSPASARSSTPSWPPRGPATSTRCSRCSTPTSSSASTAGAARTRGRQRWARRPWRASC